MIITTFWCYKKRYIFQERAFDKFFTPWAIATINTIAWSVVMHIYKDKFILNLEQVTSLYNLVLTTALAFLLVFRLNRVAIRWWDTRTMWGTIVADARILTSCILEHVRLNAYIYIHVCIYHLVYNAVLYSI